MWQTASNNVMNLVFHRRQGVSYWLRRFQLIRHNSVPCCFIVLLFLVIDPATLMETADCGQLQTFENNIKM